MNEANGWLFDFYPSGSNMVFWFILDQEGPRLRLVQPYSPYCYIKTRDEHRLPRFMQTLTKTRSFRWIGPTTQKDFWTGHPQPLYQLQVMDLEHAYTELQMLYRKYPEFSYFDCDIPFEQFYAYTHNLFPTAYCHFRYEGDNLLECQTLEDIRDTDYPTMPLRTATLHGEGYLGAHSACLRYLALEMDERTFEWNTDNLLDTLQSLNACLDEWDPDLIRTTGGDSLLMPCLFQISATCGIPLRLDRDPGIRRKVIQQGRSYQSYGRVIYRAPDYPLWGRWHIDHQNSFIDHEANLDGLIEASRVSRLPLQRMSRRSIGSGISSVQIAFVSQHGFPIPWKKAQPEAWKSALQLIRSDRGGLTHQPRLGVFENVVELDFVSMYPSIMTRFNISPETINCDCCPDSPLTVPELGYRICQKRSGMISDSLIPLLEKRVEYKHRMKEATDPAIRRRYKDRQTALKWLLVCCFGYLGYKNARFGRIEAHESICAISREMLLRTRHLCEKHGYRILHSLVDCVWIQESQAGCKTIPEICQIIEEETQLRIAVEGRYSWLVFLSSTQHDDLPVPARYFGRFEDGSLKYRGIEIRRNDQPPFIKKVQGELLSILAEADSIPACRNLEPRLRATVAESEQLLIHRQVPLQELLLRKHLSRRAEEYRSNGMVAVAARQAARMGNHLIGGQDVYFLVTDSKSGNPDLRICLVEKLLPETNYDVAFYQTLLQRAVSTLLDPILGKSLPAREPTFIQQRLF